jgi:transposase
VDLDELAGLDLDGASIAELRAAVRVLQSLVAELRAELVGLRLENQRLREELSRRGGPPSWVRPNRSLANKKAKEQQKQERKRRSNRFARKREEPTQTVYHSLEHCPDCGRRLSGGWEHSRRQVIDIPAVAVQVIEHVVEARYCGFCKKRRVPRLELRGSAIGRHRFGIGLMSLVGCLRQSCRLPVRRIQHLLADLYGVSVSVGEIVHILATIAGQGGEKVAGLLEQLRHSRYVHGDETGWRQAGRNGYLWSFSTPAVRYFHYDRSRAGLIPKEVLGEEFDAVVVSDFYSGYNGLECRHQRCWVHLLRDLHKLKEDHPDHPEVVAWADQVVALYREAISYWKGCRRAAARSPGIASLFGPLQRRDRRRQYETALAQMAYPYMDHKGADADPRTVLSKRIERFAGELFVFIEEPDIPPDNNPAERAIRPTVILRKIVGGTRSEQGSKTLTTLASLYGTWNLQGLNVIQECRKLLTGPVPATQSSH